MNTPLDYTLDQLCELSPEALDRFARGAAGGLARSRLFLGRILVAIDCTDAHDSYGCHSSTHYALTILGLTERFAKRARYVARRLDALPALSAAAEAGVIGWSALRTILPVCNEKNEEQWLVRAQTMTARELEQAVRYEQFGDGSAQSERSVELTFKVSPETAALLQWVVRDLSRTNARRMNGEDCLEALCAEHLAGVPFPSEATWRRLREEAQRDVQAEAARVRESARRAGLILQPDAVEPNETAEVASEATRASDENPLADLWQTVATREEPCPGAPSLVLVRSAPSWENQRLRFSGQARLLTEPQRHEILRRDGYACSTPGCPHTLWLHVHHVIWYCQGGLTVPSNLLTVCSACHRALHRGTLRVRDAGPRGPEWLDAAGRSLQIFRAQAVPDWWAQWFRRLCAERKPEPERVGPTWACAA